MSRQRRPVRSPLPPLTMILRWHADGEHHAAVYEIATRRRLAVAHGSDYYTRRAAALFASCWDSARRDFLSTRAEVQS